MNQNVLSTQLIYNCQHLTTVGMWTNILTPTPSGDQTDAKTVEEHENKDMIAHQWLSKLIIR